MKGNYGKEVELTTKRDILFEMTPGGTVWDKRERFTKKAIYRRGTK